MHPCHHLCYLSHLHHSINIHCRSSVLPLTARGRQASFSPCFTATMTTRILVILPANFVYRPFSVPPAVRTSFQPYNCSDNLRTSSYIRRSQNVALSEKVHGRAERRHRDLDVAMWGFARIPLALFMLLSHTHNDHYASGESHRRTSESRYWIRAADLANT